MATRCVTKCGSSTREPSAKWWCSMPTTSIASRPNWHGSAPTLWRKVSTRRNLLMCQYVDALGREGIFQTEHRVYDRAGERCITCRKARIVRRVVAGRSTCFCPRCQH
ncbi:MAG: hypothetical protein EBW53_02635 [Actinobacteria bacterium]|nr:hypothetical protein [Actinomycetota bacterium]